MGKNLLRQRCPYCDNSRFSNDTSHQAGEEFFPDEAAFSTLKPTAFFEYIPIIPRLKLLFASPKVAEMMRYSQRLKQDPWNEGIRDAWEGDVMQKWHTEGMF
jgi:hypothetical protein